MNKIFKKSLLARDKSIPWMYLRRVEFKYSACGPFTKHKERIQKFKETGVSRRIYQHKIDETCFQHDLGYGDFKGLSRRIASDEKLRNKAFNIAKNLK